MTGYMLYSFEPIHLYIFLLILGLSLIVVWVKYRNIFHVLFCAIFGIYLIGVISVAVFPFVIGESNSNFRLSLNLIPFNFGNCFEYMPQNCAKDIFNNILLAAPFGFLIHFIARIKPKYSTWILLAIGVSFEFTQLIMAFAFHIGFRTIDINDTILNTLGAFIGYFLFKIFAKLYLKTIQTFNLQPRHIFAYVYNIITPLPNH